MEINSIKKLLLISLLTATISCSNSTKKDTVIVYQTESKQWAYKIKLQNRIIIKQEYIPALEGNKPFKNKKDALNIGKLVLRKLLKNQKEFPDITLKEIDSLKIDY
jgi:hypothetical protein